MIYVLMVLMDMIMASVKTAFLNVLARLLRIIDCVHRAGLLVRNALGLQPVTVSLVINLAQILILRTLRTV